MEGEEQEGGKPSEWKPICAGALGELLEACLRSQLPQGVAIQRKGKGRDGIWMMVWLS